VELSGSWASNGTSKAAAAKTESERSTYLWDAPAPSTVTLRNCHFRLLPG